MTIEKTQSIILKDLGDGLVLRHATPDDADRLADFNSRIHSDDGPDKPFEPVGIWTRDLLTLPHPTFNPGDFTIVEDTATGEIVSSLNLISQEWSFAGIPFKVGRPELVGTKPEYRNRGLVRAQFEAIHTWSAQRGELVQGITGIPYYYRLFGYEMVMTLGGGRAGYLPQVPKLKEGETEPYLIRPAVESDLPFIAGLVEQADRRYLVSCRRDAEMWRYELNGKSARNIDRTELCVIETPESEPVGVLGHSVENWGPMLAARLYEVKPGISWAAVTPSVIRFVFAAGRALAARDGKEAEFSSFGLWFGPDHPVYHIVPDRLPRDRKSYAWYIRVPDLPVFLRHIQPVLEQRLAGSSLAGHSGELKITFYRSGLKLLFEQGRITEISSWKPEPLGHSGDAAFPELTFLQLLFGYRNLEELNYAFADCWWDNDTAYALLTTLFPKQISSVWPVS